MECRKAGHYVYNGSLRDPKGKGDERAAWAKFDRSAEVSLKYTRNILGLYNVPPDVLDEVEREIRCMFQAQIMHLRFQDLAGDALELFHSNPGKLARDPELLAVFEKAMGLGNKKTADEMVAWLRRSFPPRPVLVARR